MKTEINGKVNRTDFTGNITSTTITVTGGNNKLLGNVSLEVADNAVTTGKIQDGAVSKDKLSDALKTEIDGKLKDDLSNISLVGKLNIATLITATGSNGIDVNESISNGIKTINISGEKLAKKDLSNVTKDTIINKVGNGNIDNPNGELLKDTDVKNYLDGNYYRKAEVDNMVGRADAALSGVSSAIAMANLPQVSSYHDRRHMLSAAYGRYAGESSISVGLSGVSKNNRVTYKVSAALNSKGNLAWGAGIGVMLGKVEEPAIEMPTTIREKLEISEIERKEMQEKLLEQNEMVNKQSEQIQELYNIIKELQQELKKR